MERKVKRKYTMKAINIKWDTDGDKELLQKLPMEIEIPEEIVCGDLFDEDEISDWLTDQTGFCHNGFELVEEDN